MNRPLFASLFSLLALFPAIAAAQEPTPVAPAPVAPPAAEPAAPPVAEPAAPHDSESKRTVSVTFSPFHLVLPVFEATAEVKLHPKVSVAVIGGGGSVKSGGLNVQVYEVGGQVRGYPFGNFDSGMTVALEALYLGAKASSEGTTAKGAGLSIGPAIGYKHAFGFGLTLDGQLGVSYLAVEASAANGSSTSSGSQSRIAPILNLNIGWSF